MTPSALALNPDQPRVAVIMGSRSDLRVMQACIDLLDELEVPFEATVVSAHRTPEWMVEYSQAAAGRGLEVIVAAAGGAAHLPGMVASLTLLPVLGVPVNATGLQGGLDALLSIVQMPKGVPVGTLAIDTSGAVNAALLATRILAVHRPNLQARLSAWSTNRRDAVLADRVIR